MGDEWQEAGLLAAKQAQKVTYILLKWKAIIKHHTTTTPQCDTTAPISLLDEVDPRKQRCRTEHR